MNHEVLGVITRTKDHSGDATATVQFESRDVEILLMPDDQPFETTLELAVDVVRALDDLWATAKRILVRDLLEVYNSGWNEYDEVQEDGSLKSVSNPKLSESEFEEQFSLSAIHLLGREIVDFFCEDGGLFWGHYVVVSSFNGRDFSTATAQLMG